MENNENINNENKNKGRFGKGIILGVIIGILASLLIIFLSVSVVQTVAYRIRDGKSDTATETGEDKKSDTDVINRSTLKKIQSIEKLIDDNFYLYSDSVSTDEIEDGIYRGIIKSLNDPYSEYFSAEELEAERNDIGGISYGIGVVVSIDEENKMPIVVSVIEQSPAEEAGVEVGDILYEVDGESTYDMPLSQVVARVKGLEGTTVNITFYREGAPDYINLDIMRGKLIETNTVVYGFIEDNEEEGIGYIDISEFDNVTVDQFAEAMAELNAKGMKGLIIDLRYNLGGSLTAVVDIARKLLPEGMIVYTEDKNGKHTEYTCDGESEIDIPLVILVNDYTASAAEILSGAVQDHNKGTLIGTTTYGKGIVQRIMALEDGSAVKLTISAYFTPSGRNIQGTGIEPDIILEFDRETYDEDGTDNQLEKAIEVIKQKIG